VLIAVVIKLQSPGPVLFRQRRIGYRGRPFFCWKFRTMHVQASDALHRRYLTALIASTSPTAKLDIGEDPRLIPAGKLLRLSGLDELPQLINVLRGEMSLIGPRPCIPYEYRNLRLWQRRRTDAMPGLTGLWQVSGKNRTTFDQMIRLDIGYARQSSPGLDLLIALRTVPALLEQMRDGWTNRFGDGRAQSMLARARHVATSPFRGELLRTEPVLVKPRV
jgi:lipopolysaccharide/colanic/teichoic acid biosynthesis glycosyltransferase